MKLFQSVIRADINLMSLIVVQKKIPSLRRSPVVEAAYHTADSLSVIQRVVHVNAKVTIRGRFDEGLYAVRSGAVQVHRQEDIRIDQLARAAWRRELHMIEESILSLKPLIHP